MLFVEPENKLSKLALLILSLSLWVDALPDGELDRDDDEVGWGIRLGSCGGVCGMFGDASDGDRRLDEDGEPDGPPTAAPSAGECGLELNMGVNGCVGGDRSRLDEWSDAVGIVWLGGWKRVRARRRSEAELMVSPRPAPDPRHLRVTVHGKLKRTH